jgi:hypothetical protein
MRQTSRDVSEVWEAHCSAGAGLSGQADTQPGTIHLNGYIQTDASGPSEPTGRPVATDSPSVMRVGDDGAACKTRVCAAAHRQTGSA